MHKPTARHRTLTKHYAVLHTVMPTLWHNGRQDGLPARNQESENTIVREVEQSKGRKLGIVINRLYTKNGYCIVLFANEFRKGGSILITISVPSLDRFLSSSAKVVQTVFES